MIDLMKSVIPYISGLYTLPWIVVGFIATIILSRIFSPTKVEAVMKKIANIVLYLFVPPLVFRIFLDTPLSAKEGVFAVVSTFTIGLMYVIAYVYAVSYNKKSDVSETNKTLFTKTMITSQGRSTAFIGGVMLAVPSWGVPAGIFMAVYGIFIFAIVPVILGKLDKQGSSSNVTKSPLPWILRAYPWFFAVAVLAGFIVQKTVALTTTQMGSWGVIIKFYTSLTIPLALYYVGSGIHPSDMKLSEIKILFGITKEEDGHHWSWVRHIFIMTTMVTPIIITIIFLILMNIKALNFPSEWFAVSVINSILPITSINIFLVPYGIDKRATVHSITWSTIFCVPIVIILVPVLSKLLGQM